MQINSYGDAVKYLESFIGKIIFKVTPDYLKKHDPLERMRVFLNLLDNPQDKFRSVLVGGTAGKGSTVYLISRILAAAGYKTGFTISPHLQRINERLQVNGRQISDLEFTRMVNSMIRIIKIMEKMPIGAPSYFEIIVGMAFKHFADRKVDIAIVEVGMGGEFDATNTLNPLIVLLTNVGLDHTGILGKTVEKIAKTKAGIIKSGKRQAASGKNKLIVVSGVIQPSVVKIIQDRSDKAEAELKLLWRDFGYKIKKISYKGSIFDLTGPRDRVQWLNDLRLSLLGSYQAENASLAIKAVFELQRFGFKISGKTIRKALKTAFFPGRFEIRKVVLRQAQGKISSTLILDGAHNPTKMRAFLLTLKKLYPKERKIFVVGFKFDKDIKKMLKEVACIADEVIVTEFKAKTDTSLHASYDAFKLKTQIVKLKTGTKIKVEKDSKKALQKAINILKTQYSNDPSAIIVTGSLYLVGEIRSML